MSAQSQALLLSSTPILSSSSSSSLSQNRSSRMMRVVEVQHALPSRPSIKLQNLMRNVIKQNNQGVDHFEREEYSSAFRCFRQALVLFKTRFQEQQQQQPQQQGFSERDPAPHANANTNTKMNVEEKVPTVQPLSCAMACTALARQHSPSSSCKEEQMIESSGAGFGFVLHTQCIRLLASFPGLLASDSLLEDRLVSGILVFNCGLVFHLQGQRTCSPEHLRKAFTLYQQAAALLQDQIHQASMTASSHCLRGKVTGNALVDLLCMAVLNNMGLILRCDFLDHAKSRRFFGQLVTYAHAFQNSYAPSLREDDRMQQEDDSESLSVSIMLALVDEFLLNAVASNCADSASAPAA